MVALIAAISLPAKNHDGLFTNSVGEQFKVVMHSDLGNTNSMEEAVVWLSKAAEQGYVEAYNSLGLIYEMIYVEYPQAIAWYRKAAAKGHAEACRNLGSIYLWGNGVDRDNMEAAKWLYKAAQKGDNIAIEYLNQYLPEEYEKLKKK